MNCINEIFEYLNLCPLCNSPTAKKLIRKFTQDYHEPNYSLSSPTLEISFASGSTPNIYINIFNSLTTFDKSRKYVSLNLLSLNSKNYQFEINCLSCHKFFAKTSALSFSQKDDLTYLAPLSFEEFFYLFKKDDLSFTGITVSNLLQRIEYQDWKLQPPFNFLKPTSLKKIPIFQLDPLNPNQILDNVESILIFK